MSEGPDPSDTDVVAAVVAVVAVLSARSADEGDPPPLREPLSPWVASGWVPPTATAGHARGSRSAATLS